MNRKEMLDKPQRYNPMRYSPTIQQAADTFAREQGYFCAVYLGPTDNALVFQPRREDNEPRYTGLASFIIYKDGEFELDRVLYFNRYSDKLRYTHYPKKGKEIFDMYKLMDNYDMAVSDADRSLIHEIVTMAHGNGHDMPVAAQELYKALEIAERLGMTIEFVPAQATMERCDGRWYFIRIVPGKLPERLSVIID